MLKVSQWRRQLLPASLRRPGVPLLCLRPAQQQPARPVGTLPAVCQGLELSVLVSVGEPIGNVRIGRAHQIGRPTGSFLPRGATQQHGGLNLSQKLCKAEKAQRFAGGELLALVGGERWGALRP
eukprot:scaffold32745_cov29-Prasinocladus_malaysianus.AAC.3